MSRPPFYTPEQIKERRLAYTKKYNLEHPDYMKHYRATHPAKPLTREQKDKYNANKRLKRNFSKCNECGDLIPKTDFLCDGCEKTYWSEQFKKDGIIKMDNNGKRIWT